MSLKVEHSNLGDFEKQINDPETTKKIAAAFENENEKLIQKLNADTVHADEVISKDRTFTNIIDLIMSADSVDAAKEIFFENLIPLMQCKEVCDFFKKEYVDENGKRYTIGRDGEKYRFTADLVKEILDDELTSTPAKQEEETVWGVTEEEFSKKFEENNGFDVKEPKNNIEKVSDDFCEFMISASKGYSDGIIERRKKSVKSLIQDFGKLTPEIESTIDACTSVSEIENIYDEVKATIPKSNDDMIDCVDILNKVSGDKPMTDAEKLEDAQDRERHALQVKDLTEKEKIRPDVPMTPEAYEELKASVRKRYKTDNGNKPDNK